MLQIKNWTIHHHVKIKALIVLLTLHFNVSIGQSYFPRSASESMISATISLFQHLRKDDFERWYAAVFMICRDNVLFLMGGGGGVVVCTVHILRHFLHMFMSIFAD